MNTEKRMLKCEGCGAERPCFVETNQEPSSITIIADNLKCILDDTNQTSYNWIEICNNETRRERVAASCPAPKTVNGQLRV